MASGTGATSIVSDCTSVRPAPQPSVARTNSVDVPQIAGVPEIEPVAGSMASPAGSDPDGIDQVTVPTLPVAAGVLRYGSPTRAAGDAGIVIENTGASIVIDSVAVALLPAQFVSDACTVIRNDPIDVGPPLSVPFASSVNPAGSVPPIRDHDVAPVP